MRNGKYLRVLLLLLAMTGAWMIFSGSNQGPNKDQGADASSAQSENLIWESLSRNLLENTY